MSGFEARDLIGQNMHIFKSGRHDAAYYGQLWDTILSGHVWRGEMTNRRKDGSFYVEEQTITPVRDDQGQIAQFIAIKQDITDRKAAEKDLRERTQLELQSMARAANESYDLMRGTLAVLQSTNSSDLFRLFTRYAEQIEERASFRIDLSSQGEPRFMSAKRMRHLFYVFREIINNIEKHAKASQVTIEMIWDPDALNLVVCDNGSGFDLDKVQYGSHYGLKFMRERVELLNGSLVIHSGADSGTSITLQAPYE
jgi:PAS domain S-box-containing protein